MKKIRVIIISATLLFAVDAVRNYNITSGDHYNSSSIYAGEIADIPDASIAGKEKDTAASSGGVLYSVMIAVLTAWVGIGIYLFLIDRRISKIEKEIDINNR